MSNFAATRRAKATDFADRIGREVIVQQEVGFIGAVQGVDHLLIIAGAQSGHDQTLRFTTGKQRGAVCAWQQAGFAVDCADGI